MAHLDKAHQSQRDPAFALKIERLSIGRQGELTRAAAYLARSLRRWQDGRSGNDDPPSELVDRFLLYFAQRDGLDHLLAVISAEELATAFQSVISAMTDQTTGVGDGDPSLPLLGSFVGARLRFEADPNLVDLAELGDLRFKFLELERRGEQGAREKRALLDELILAAAGARPGTIGVEFRKLKPDELSALGLEPPVQLVEGVVDGLPADAAGLQAGDLILAVDGQPPKIRWGDPLVDLAFAGESVTLTIRRADVTLNKTMTLVASKVGGTRAWVSHNRERLLFDKNYLGHAVDKLLHGGVLAVGQQIFVAAKESSRGVIVVHRRTRQDDSLIPGDRIFALDGEALGGAEALKAKLDAACNSSGLAGNIFIQRQRGEAVEKVGLPLQCGLESQD